LKNLARSSLSLNRETEIYYRTCNEYIDLHLLKTAEAFSKYASFLKPDIMGGLVLDVACGGMQAVNLLADEGWNSIGIDLTPKYAKNRSDSSHFIVADAYKLPFRNSSFSSVGCKSVLEHLCRPEKCLEEMVRVLKTSGKIVITGPNFMQVLGPSFHRYTKRFSRRLINIVAIFKNLLLLKLSPARVHFSFINPNLDWTGKTVAGDEDAVCMINPLLIKRFLRKLGVRIVYQSPAPTYMQSNLLNVIARLAAFVPFVREMGGIFIVGRKICCCTEGNF
jgi:ubiquinone/menaquinone biosynthesis C-methylase UbiE